MGDTCNVFVVVSKRNQMAAITWWEFSRFFTARRQYVAFSSTTQRKTRCICIGLGGLSVGYADLLVISLFGVAIGYDLGHAFCTRGSGYQYAGLVRLYTGVAGTGCIALGYTTYA